MIPPNDKLVDQREVWDSIADKWAEYREEPIGEVTNFLKDKSGNVLDLGCGSGRNLCFINGKIFGVDFSKEQVNNAYKKAKSLTINFEGVVADCCKLPFDDCFFDSAICISTIHCIKGEDERKKAVSELFRVLKHGSSAFISVWNKHGPRAKGKKEEHVGFFVDGVSYKRYYYYFDEEEFFNLLKSVGFEIIKILKSDYKSSQSNHSRKNFSFEVRKP